MVTERGQGEGNKYSGKGNPVRELFNDKWGLSLKQMGGGEEDKSFPRTGLIVNRPTES